MARIVLGSVLFLALAGPGPADTIVLANGNVLRGEIVSEDERSVHIRLEFGTIEVPRDEIREIRRESGPAARLAQAEDLAACRAYPLAVELAERALAEAPEPDLLARRVAAIHLSRGRFLAGRGSFAAAERAFLRAIELDPGPAAAREGLEASRAKALAASRALAQARSALAAGEWDGAISGVERLLAAAPDLEDEAAPVLFEALVARGDLNLEARGLDGAFADYDRALRIQPERSRFLESRWCGTLVARVYEGSILGQRHREALESLGRAAIAFPGNPLVAFATGLAREGLGDPEGARRAYLEAVAGVDSGGALGLEEAREAARRALGLAESVGRPVLEDARWAESTADWQETSSARFVVRHRHPHAAQRVLRALESGFERVSGDMAAGRAVAWPRPCEVLLHADAAAFREATGQPEWVEGATEVQGRSGRLVSHRIHLYLGSEDLLTTTVPHELAHAILPALAGYGQRLPAWLGEGVAVRFEPAETRSRRMRRLARAMAEGRAPSPGELVAIRGYPADPAAVEVYYAASYAFVDWLLTLGGWNDLIELGRQWGDRGREGLPEALRRVYGSRAPADEGALDAAWARHVAKS